MLHPSRALLDIFPKVAVGGRDEGIVAPGNVNKQFLFQYSINSGSEIAWRVPLNTTFYIPKGYTWEPYTQIDFTGIAREQLELLYFLQESVPPDEATRGGKIFNPKELAAFSPEQVAAFFDYTVRPGGIIAGLGRQQTVGGLVLHRAFTSSGCRNFLEGRVPFLSEYGERFTRSGSLLASESSRLFNYPKSLLEYRYITSNVLRILIELSKTPRTFMIYPADEDGFIDATDTGQIAVDATAAAQILQPTVYTPILLEEIDNRRSITPFTPDKFLYAPLIENPFEMDNPRTVSESQVPSCILWNMSANYGSTTRADGYEYGVNASNAMSNAIGGAIAQLKAGNIPQFVIPKEYGGGEKYLVLLPYLPNALDMLTLEKEALFIGVPLSLLVSATYPYTNPQNVDPANRYIPYNTALTAYVVGSPGIFNFNPFDYKNGLVSDKVTDFDRLDKEGWNDRNTYFSARAPMGQLLWTKTVVSDINDAIPLQSYWHLNSQDTIKIVSAPVNIPPQEEKAKKHCGKAPTKKPKKAKT